MYHPSIYVLVTDLDDMEEIETGATPTNNTASQNSFSCGVQASSADAAVLTAISSSAISAVTNVSTNMNCLENNNINTTMPPYAGVGKQQSLLESLTSNYLNKTVLSSSSLSSSVTALTSLTATTAATATSITAPIATSLSSSLTTTAMSTTTKPFTNIVERFKIDNKNISSSMLYDQSNHYALTSKFTCNMINTHAPPQVATEMPERVWQECITNTLHVQHQNNLSNSNWNSSGNINSMCINGNGSALPSITTNTTTTTTTLSASTTCTSATTTTASTSALITVSNNKNILADNLTANEGNEPADIKPNISSLTPKQQLWEFVDPTLKAPCICAK